MSTITFSDRVRSRWRASIAMFAVGLAGAELLVWVIMSFIVFVALSAAGYVLAPEIRRLLLVSVQICVGFVGLWMWIVRGIQIRNVDTLLASAGPMERELIAARIKQEGVQMIDITGGPT